MARKISSSTLQIKKVPPSLYNQPIFLFQSPETRAVNLGYIRKGKNGHSTFIPARLNFGSFRSENTYAGTNQTLQLPEIKKLLSRFRPEKISTITVLRETLSCRLWEALTTVGIENHYGDAFIGANHVKSKDSIKTAYLYENTEGLVSDGLWVIADSICIGRNLAATLSSLLANFHPKHILIIAPIASRRGINALGEITNTHLIPTTFVAWGGLFGVDEETLYNMPWGHPDTVPVDPRDQKLFLSIYGPNLCMGGDFGNNYFCPPLALSLYKNQLKEYTVVPKIPTAEKVLTIYKPKEILLRE